MTSAQEMNPIDRVTADFGHMPIEILIKIFRELTFAQKKNARLVCNLWRAILDDKSTFRATITDHSVLTLLRSCRQMDQVVIRGVTKRLPRMSTANNRYPRIKEAVIGWKNSEATIKSFLALGTGSVESLEFSKFSLERVRPRVIGDLVQKIDWNRVRKLNITVAIGRRKSENHANATLALMQFGKFPNLDTFEFVLSRSYSQRPRQQRVLLSKIAVQFYSFLVAHSGSLTILNVFLNGWAQFLRTHPADNFKIPALPLEILEGLSSLKIQECSLETSGKTQALETMIYPCLTTGTLKRFKRHQVGIRARYSLNEWADDIRKFCRANSTTLEELEIQRCMEFVFDPSCLSSCIAMKSLKIRDPSSFNRPEFSKLIFPGLKTLEIPVLSILHINSENRERIENLTITEIYLFGRQEHVQFLPFFVALKSLHLSAFTLDLMEVLSNRGAVFPKLAEFQINLLQPFCDPRYWPELTFDPAMKFPNWINEAMPVLEVLAVGKCLPRPHIEMLMALPKLRRLECYFVEEAGILANMVKTKTLPTSNWK